MERADPDSAGFGAGRLAGDRSAHPVSALSSAMSHKVHSRLARAS
jgi:hypothetical protein